MIKPCKKCNHPKNAHVMGWIPLPNGKGTLHVMPCSDCDCDKYEFDNDPESAISYHFNVVGLGSDLIVTVLECLDDYAKNKD